MVDGASDAHSSKPILKAMAPRLWVQVLLRRYLRENQLAQFSIVSLVIIFVLATIISTILSARLNENIELLAAHDVAMDAMMESSMTGDATMEESMIEGSMTGDPIMEESMMDRFIEDTEPFSIPSLTRNVQNLQRVTYGLMGGGFLILYVSLVSIVWRGVTARRRAEQKLARKAQELTRSNVELVEFASGVSHDLRAPLRAIKNYSLFLQEDNADQLDEMGLEYVEGIAESAQQLDALVVDLLEYSRIGRTEAEMSAVDTGELLERVVTRLGLRAQAQLRLPVDAPIVRAQEVYLDQIFSNLLGNAVKFHRPEAKPVIAVAWADRGNAWEFSVCDNGIGIEEKHAEKIFSIFQRLHTSDEYEGTGIGLAIVQKAVEERGGRVWAQSTNGQGSVFTFTMPKQIQKE